LTVRLFSSNTGEASVPAEIVIPAGSNSATFIVNAVDELIADGTQTVTITATAAGFVTAVDTIDVLDDETRQLSLAIVQPSISENGGLSLASVSRIPVRSML
jgi:hypothetical protein